MALLSVSRSTKPIGLSFGSFSNWPAAAVIAAIAFVAVQIGQSRGGQLRATLTGLGAGLVFGIQDALTRQTLEILQGQSYTALFHAWAPYCLLATGIVGLWLMQNAFSAGPLHASLPTIAAGEPVAGIVLGIVVFGDRIQVSPAQLAIEAGGIAALIVGVVMVARSSAFGGLHKITDVIRPDSATHPVSHANPAAPGKTASPGKTATRVRRLGWLRRLIPPTSPTTTEPHPTGYRSRRNRGRPAHTGATTFTAPRPARKAAEPAPRPVRLTAAAPSRSGPNPGIPSPAAPRPGSASCPARRSRFRRPRSSA